MTERYAGKLTFEDGQSVSIDLAFDRDVLELSAEGNPVGSWPVKYCRVSRTGTGSFLLSIDGEKVVFAPDDVESFALAAAQRFHASSLADRIDVIREASAGVAPVPELIRADAPAPEPRLRTPMDWRLLAMVTTIAVIAISAGVLVLNVGRDSDGGAAPVATSPTPSTTVEPGFSDLFDQRPAEFVAAWNAAASELGVDALIRGQLTIGTFETSLARYVSLLGTTDESDDTIASVVVVIDPAGDTDDDQLALAILGVAITVAEPELTGAERRAVLEQLGLDVDRPDLTGLDGETRHPGVRYTMQYFPEFSSLLFSMMAP